MAFFGTFFLGRRRAGSRVCATVADDFFDQNPLPASLFPTPFPDSWRDIIGLLFLSFSRRGHFFLCYLESYSARRAFPAWELFSFFLPQSFLSSPRLIFCPPSPREPGSSFPSP